MNLRFTLSNETLGTEVLEYSPKGWQDLTIKITRDPEYHGMAVEYPANLQFHCKAGYEYLRQGYKQLGIDGQITITIDKCCGNRPVDTDSEDYSDDYSDEYGSSLRSLGSCIWEPFITGLMEMKNIKIDPKYVTLPIIQSSEYQKFKNRIDNTVSLSDTESLDGVTLDLIDPIDFTLHNKGIVLVSKATIPNEISYVGYEKDSTSGDFNTVYTHTPPLIFGDENFIQEGYDLGINIESFNVDLPNIYENITPYQRYVNVEFRLKFEIVLGVCKSLGGGGNFPNETRIFISKFTNDDPLDIAANMTQLLYRDICNGGSRFVDFTFSQMYLVDPGQKIKVWIATAISGTGIGAGVEPPAYAYDSANSYFAMKGELPFPETITKSYGLFETGALISQRILDKELAFESETFGRVNSLPTSYDDNGCDSFGVMFNGLMARNFPFPANPLRMSLKSYYAGLSPIYNLGMGIEKIAGDYRVLVEKKTLFYKNEVLFRLKNVPNINTSLMQDYFFSEVRFGFENWETEEVSGIDEFNTKRYYNTGIKAIDNILEKISTFIASGYSIELTRRKQWKSDNTNEDYKNDNEIFIACTNRSVDGSNVPTGMDRAEKNENYTDVTGIYSPQTCYNLRISPERNKIRHNGIIAPSLLKYIGRLLRFTYGEGNYKAAYRGTDDCDVFSNEILAGNQNVAWDDDRILELSIWNPIVDEFIFPLTQSQVELMVDDNLKLIQYGKDEEEIIEGWILEAEPNLQSGLTKFKMLRKYVD